MVGASDPTASGCAPARRWRTTRGLAGYHTNVGAKRARQYRAELGLEPDEPLECLLTVVEQRAGIPVAVVEIAEGFAGAYLRAAGGRRRSSCTAPDWPTRKRFSLAHELGHHRLGHEPVIDTWEAMYAFDRPPEETQANAFAAEFVAPRAGIERWLEEHAHPPVNLDLVCRLSALLRAERRVDPLPARHDRRADGRRARGAAG